MPSFTCLNCHKESLNVCGCCRNSFYCGKECQKDDWTKRHKYESFLFKARDPLEKKKDEKDSDREREKRVKVEKVRTEGDLLREQYQEINQLVKKTRSERPKTKREMSMTHVERQRYLFAVSVGLKDFFDIDLGKEETDFVRDMESMVEEMNLVPLTNGDQREVVLGPVERVEIGHMLMRKRIYYLKLDLLLMTKSVQLSKEIIAYKQMMDEKERKFSFQLFVRESDGVTYDEVMAKAHGHMDKEIIDSWIENAYIQSMSNAKEETIQFIDHYKNIPNAREKHGVNITREEHEAQLEYVKNRITVAKNCSLQFALSTTENSFKRGILTEEEYQITSRHYQELSDRLDKLVEEEKDQIIEDMERMLRRHYGEEWPSVEKFLFGEYVEKDINERGLSIITGLQNPSWKKTKFVFWAMVAFHLFLLAFMYFFGFVSYSIGDLVGPSSNERTAEELVKNFDASKEPLEMVNENMKLIIRDVDAIQDRLKKVNMTEFYTHAYTDLNSTTSVAALDTINLTVDKAFFVTRDLIKETLASPLGKAGKKDAGIKTLVELKNSIEEYLDAQVTNYTGRSKLLADIASTLQLNTELVVKMGGAQSNQILDDILGQVSNLVLNMKDASGQLVKEVSAVQDRSRALTEKIKEYRKLYENVRTPVITPLLPGANTFGRNTPDRLREIATNGTLWEKIYYTTIGDAWDASKNTLIASESYLLQAYAEIPLIDDTWYAKIVRKLFGNNIRNAQMLFYSVLSTGQWVIAAMIAKWAITVKGYRTSLKNVGSSMAKACMRCWSKPTGGGIFEPQRETVLDNIIKEVGKMERAGEYTFYEFYDLTLKYNLTTDERIALWYRSTTLKDFDSHDLKLAKLGFYLQSMYYHGYVNFSFLTMGVYFYSTLGKLWEFFKMVVQYLVHFFALPVDFTSGYLTTTNVFIALGFVFSIIVAIKTVACIVSCRCFGSGGSDGSEKLNVVLDKLDRLEEHLPSSKRLVGRIRAPTSSGSKSTTNWLLKFGFSVLRYVNLISFVSYWGFVAITLITGVENPAEKLADLTNVFFGWQEPTENLVLGSRLADDYNQSITAYRKLASETDNMIEVYNDYTRQTQFNSADVAINQLMTILFAANATLSEAMRSTKKVVDMTTT